MGLILLTAAAMLAFFLWSPGGGSVDAASVYMEGKLVQKISLREDGSYPVAGMYHNTVTVRDGKIAITESDCPGQDCVHSGWISSPGRSIVCLPNRVEIRLEGSGGAQDVDAVVR